MLRQIALSLMSVFIFATSTSFAEDARWDGLLEKIKIHGEYLPTDFGDYMVLSNVVPNDRNKSRIASYISGVGGFHPDGVTFIISHVEVVWEDWKLISEDTFQVDQWLFGVSVDGTIYRKGRSVLKLTKSGTYLGSEYPETSEAEFEKKWSSLRLEWYLLYDL